MSEEDETTTERSSSGGCAVAQIETRQIHIRPTRQEQRQAKVPTNGRDFSSTVPRSNNGNAVRCLCPYNLSSSKTRVEWISRLDEIGQGQMLPYAREPPDHQDER